jgi:hypothetical protein
MGGGSEPPSPEMLNDLKEPVGAPHEGPLSAIGEPPDGVLFGLTIHKPHH